MSLSDDEIAAIRESFRAVGRDAPLAGRVFYERLFALAPETRALFRGDIDGQSAKLMAVLGTVVAHLDRLDAIAPAVAGLAGRHAGYGVRPEHYRVVGAALLAMLGDRLGAAARPETLAAWAKAYGVLAGLMVASAWPDAAAA